VPQDHLLLPIRVMADAMLEEFGARFDAMYAQSERRSDPTAESRAQELQAQ
jgi:hypothetical protein